MHTATVSSFSYFNNWLAMIIIFNYFFQQWILAILTLNVADSNPGRGITNVDLGAIVS